MPPGIQAYTAAHFVLELAGKTIGDVTSVEGGAVVGQVTGTDQGTPPVRRKDLSGVGYEPIVIGVGADVGTELWDWIADTMDNKLPRRDGRILFLDYQRREKSSLSWTDGLLTEIRFPELDYAAKDPAAIRLTIEADTVTPATSGAGATIQPTSGRTQKSWSAQNYRLTLSGMNSAPASTSWVGPITVKQPYIPPPTPGSGGGGAAAAASSLDVSDLSVAVLEQNAGELYDWHRRFVIQGQTGQQYELTGKIEYLDPTRSQTLFGLDLKGLGIRRIASERLVTGVSTIARARADMYIEDVDLVKPTAATTPTGTTGAAGTTGATGPAASGATGGGSGPGTGPTGIGAELVELLRAAVSAGEVATLSGRSALDADAVAERLMRSAEAADGDDGTEAVVNDRVGEGRRIGLEWARNHAALAELEEIAAVAATDWNALTLGAEHSLTRDLRKAGVISAELVGDVVLERDPFIEGVVDGASEVYSEVRPALRERGVRPR